eukprot:g1151.t1
MFWTLDWQAGGAWIGNETSCNNVNVWAPAGAGANSAFPVLVWIHGGSFTSATPALPAYNCTRLVALAAKEGRPIVCASLQYRLGGLGFMAHAALAREPGASGSSGNYGILDQIAGLKWVQRNVAQFGGDPSKVTIFGESAGAYSVTTLLASPLAVGLFRAAVQQSSYAANTWQSSAVANQVGTVCSLVNKCQQADAAAEVACLRGLDATKAFGCDSALLSRSAAGNPFVGGGSVARLLALNQIQNVVPNVDGYVLHERPVRAIERGTTPGGAPLPHVPVVIGSNEDEFMAFALQKNLEFLWPLTREQYPEGVRALVAATWWNGHLLSVPSAYDATAGVSAAAAAGGAADPYGLPLADLYSRAESSLWAPRMRQYVQLLHNATIVPTAEYRRLVAAVTDSLFTSTAQSVAAAASARGLPSYRYLFRGTAPFPASLLGAFHSLDVAYVFGNFDQYIPGLPWPAPTAAQSALSGRMMRRWLNFALSGGDPNSPLRVAAATDANANASAWPHAGTDGGTYLSMSGSGDKAGGGFHAGATAFWARHQRLELCPPGEVGGGQWGNASGAAAVAPCAKPPAAAPASGVPGGTPANATGSGGTPTALGVGLGLGLGVPAAAALLLLARRARGPRDPRLLSNSPGSGARDSRTQSVQMSSAGLKPGATNNPAYDEEAARAPAPAL